MRVKRCREISPRHLLSPCLRAHWKDVGGKGKADAVALLFWRVLPGATNERRSWSPVDFDDWVRSRTRLQFTERVPRRRKWATSCAGSLVSAVGV